MTGEKIFPTILIILSVCAGLAYIPVNDWRHVIYWFAAAALNASVTY